MNESTDEENNKYPRESNRKMSSDSSDRNSDDSSILSNEPMQVDMLALFDQTLDRSSSTSLLLVEEI